MAYTNFNLTTSGCENERGRLRTAFYCEALFGIDKFSTATALLFFVTFRAFSYSDFFLYISIIFFVSSMLEIPLGTLGDFFSKKYLFIIGKIIFVIGFFLAIFSYNIYSLVFSAIITGIGQSVQSRNFMSLMFERFRHIGELEIHEADIIKARSIALLFNSGIIVIGGFLGEESLLYPMLADVALIGISIATSSYFIPNINSNNNFTSKKNIALLKSIKKNTIDLLEFIKENLPSFLTLITFGVALSFLSRTSFSLYQPILFKGGWSIKDIGFIISLSCFLGGVLGLFMPRYLRRARSFTPYAAGAILLTFCAGGAFLGGTIGYFGPLLGIIIHQLMRSSLLGAAPFYANTLLPDSGAFRVTFNATFSVLAGLSLGLGSALTGPFINNFGAQGSMVGLHLMVFVVLLLIYPIARKIQY